MDTKKEIKLNKEVNKRLEKSINKEYESLLIKNLYDLELFEYLLDNKGNHFKNKFILTEKFIQKIFLNLINFKNVKNHLLFLENKILESKMNVDFSNVLLNACLHGF